MIYHKQPSQRHPFSTISHKIFLHSYITIGLWKITKKKCPYLIKIKLWSIKNTSSLWSKHKHVSDRLSNFLTLPYGRNDFSNSAVLCQWSHRNLYFYNNFSNYPNNSYLYNCFFSSFCVLWLKVGFFIYIGNYTNAHKSYYNSCPGRFFE